MIGTSVVELFDTSEPMVCAFCGALAVVPLPAGLLSQQADGTTHVCLPVEPWSGCNQGYAVPPQVATLRPAFRRWVLVAEELNRGR